MGGAIKSALRPMVRGIFGSIKGVHTAQPVVALTFDDGPNPDATGGILDSLAGHEAKATFFFISRRAAKHPELARRVHREGHQVGLHGQDHLPLPLLTTRAMNERIRGGQRELEGIIGDRISWFRPPYGEQTIRSYLVTRLAGMRVVGWTTTCQDWLELDAEEIADRAATRLSAGGILLMHDFVEPDVREPEPVPAADRVRIVELLLEKLDQKGLSPVTVSELLTAGEPAQTLWFPSRQRAC